MESGYDIFVIQRLRRCFVDTKTSRIGAMYSPLHEIREGEGFLFYMVVIIISRLTPVII